MSVSVCRYIKMLSNAKLAKNTRDRRAEEKKNGPPVRALMDVVGEAHVRKRDMQIEFRIGTYAMINGRPVFDEEGNHFINWSDRWISEWRVALDTHGREGRRETYLRLRFREEVPLQFRACPICDCDVHYSHSSKCRACDRWCCGSCVGDPDNRCLDCTQHCDVCLWTVPQYGEMTCQREYCHSVVCVVCKWSGVQCPMCAGAM